MAELFFVLAAMVVLFFAILLVKELLKNYLKEFCAVCAAVSLTWIVLLVLYWLRIFDNTIILALLIGESTVGVFYLVEAKVRKELALFRLPFLLTLIVAGYSLVSVPDDLIKSSMLLVSLWFLFMIVHIYKDNPAFSSAVKKIVECCKRW
jgi:hypothetical protein